MSRVCGFRPQGYYYMSGMQRDDTHRRDAPVEVDSHQSAMITQTEADALAEEWIAAWNKHDLEAILSHYHPNVVFHSPFAAKLHSKKSGEVRGLEELRTYFTKALAIYPDLNFTLFHALVSFSSVIVYYGSVDGMLAAEVMEVDPKSMKILRVVAHYKKPSSLSG